MAQDDKHRAGHTLVFLRMTAIELRRMLNDQASNWSERDATTLMHMADQCGREADELERSMQRPPAGSQMLSGKQRSGSL